MNQITQLRLTKGEIEEFTITRDQVDSFLKTFNRAVLQAHYRSGKKPTVCLLPSHCEFILKSMAHFERMVNVSSRSNNDELFGVKLFFSADVDKFVFGYRSGELP